MSLKTQRLIGKAKKCLKNGNFDEAEKIYKGILKEFPDNVEAPQELEKIPKNSPKINTSKPQLDSVIILYTLAQYDEALRSAKSLINDYPTEPSLLKICGACYVAKGAFDDAINNFQKAIELMPDYAAVHYNLGGAYRATGQRKLSIDCYQKAIELNHAYPDAHNNLGLMFLEDRELKSATEHF